MRVRNGVILLEAMLALALLAIASVTFLSMTAAAQRTIQFAARAEDRVVRAGRLMDAVSLWPREDLDRRLGSRREGEWTLIIQRSQVNLYDVVIADSTGNDLILRTTLFRRDQ